MTHHGSCHCGRITFEVDGEIDSGLSCNCSMCHRRGSVLWFVPHAALRLSTPEADAASYTFNKHTIAHRFCATCGIHVWGEGEDPQGNVVAAINLRCVDGVDLKALPVHEFDGRAL
ncbi:GFA family protein [Arenimonas composti]|uniref:CENP-V/GFA domain-containing protein n=1 Tax=Arenimonas composti TR7-09 = DSM 18010 TaxID=1121013 RepID=A0A091BFG4_9GAMM|nr:GFA family protein [Arenimonas composti]KFN50451.1 hypothetical protein P873_07245 [Arenimonas composti TR7-09 = DSM 18010]